MNKDEKKMMVPKLRFPEFRDAGEWEVEKLDRLIDTVTPPQKLPTALYQTDGQYPIFDQSQSYICGWTNNREALIKDDLPLIIFGDHTCVLKISQKPFAQGADGIKILKAKKEIEILFLFQSLQFKPVVMEEYKRHFSILKEKLIAFPKIETGEQQKIADCLSSIDELINAQSKKIEALKTHKKGLVQQLFPRLGETIPRLRFPEFRDAEEWKVSTLGDISTITSGGTPSRSKLEYWSGTIPWVTTSLIDFNVIQNANEFISSIGLKESSAKIFPRNTILMAMYGQGITRGKVAVLGIDAATNQACAAILLKEEMNTNFVFQNLASRYDEIREMSNQGGQENLSGGLIEKISFSFPNNDSEQQKIADCLSCIDEQISAHSKKLDAIRTHKKGLMQRIFPTADYANAEVVA